MTPARLAIRRSNRFSYGKQRLRFLQRIRKNLMGKRVVFMARSVITGDNSIRLNEVGIPISVARSISIPETVRPYNRNRLTTYYINKRNIYPGCTRIVKISNGRSYNIDHLDETYQLQDGDIIMRDVITGDVVGFNRQPSLLWSSISCHKIVVLEDSLTFRLNVATCNLYNADSTHQGQNNRH